MSLQTKVKTKQKVNQKQMEKGSDQTNEWQGEILRDGAIQFGRLDLYVKEGVVFLSACIYLFVFWLVMSHTTWVVWTLHNVEWALFPQIIKTIPHKKLMFFSTFITGLTALSSCLFKKFRSDKEDFALVKLFPKNAIRKPSSSSRSYHE